MNNADDTRQKVSEAYTRAVSAPTDEGCCGPKGVAARTAGYDATALAGVPQEAAINAFGCGNPTAFLDVKEGDVVLDLGCGGGLDLLLAAPRVGPKGKVIGVDMTDEMVELARKNIEKAGVTNVEVRKGIIEELPVEAASVDHVISNCVINLSPEKARVFGEITRVLRPGGHIVISDLVVDDLPDWIRSSRRLYDSCIGGAIPESAYVAGLEAAGMTNVTTELQRQYSEEELEELVRSEIKGDIEAERVKAAARALAGKVRSLRFRGRRAP